MGSDMHYYVQEVVQRAHSGLMQACLKSRQRLLDLGVAKNDPIIIELTKVINNGTIQ